MLFEPAPTLAYEPYPVWVDSYADWSEVGSIGVGDRRQHDGWHWLNQVGVRRGRLFGGCIEALEYVNGSAFWPTEHFWRDRILFLETSEDKPSVEQERAWLFSYWVQGAFDHLAGLLVGRATRRRQSSTT